MMRINEKWSSILKNIILFCLLMAFFGASFNWGGARKVVYFCSVIALFILIFSEHKMDKKDFWLPCSVFLFGISLLFWVLCFGSWGGRYYSYQSLGKISIASSILMCLYSSKYFNCSLAKKSARMWVCAVWLLLLLGILMVSCYQYFYLHVDRVGVGSTIATMAAYIVSIAGLLGVGFMQKRCRTKWSILFLMMLFILTYTSIYFTETRSAILGFPFLFAIAVLVFQDKIRLKALMPLMSVLMLVFIIVIFNFGATFYERMNELVEDIQQYTEQHNTESSFGARIAMFYSGMEAGKHKPLGQSIESRAAVIEKYIEQNPVYEGALLYIYTNLHNDIIENFSLRGIWGVSLLFFMYGSLVYTAIKQRNAVLLAVGLSVMLYGLTDVIFSDDLPLTYYIAIIVLLCVGNNIKARNADSV